MLLHFGVKNSRQVYGRVADYCLFCHCRRPFTVEQIARYFHIMLIPLYELSVLGYEKRCESCEQVYDARIDDYTDIATNPRCGLETLIKFTNPNLSTGVEAEWKANERLLGKAVVSNDRAALMAGPFHAVRARIVLRGKEQHVDFWSAAAALATLVVPGAIFILFGVDDVSVRIAGISAAAFLLLAIALLATERTRYINKTVRPSLVRALVPFRATEEELELLAANDPVVAGVVKRIGLKKLHECLTAEVLKRTEELTDGPE